MSYYMYNHPLNSNGQGKTPSVVKDTPGAITFMENSLDVYAMCEGTAKVGFLDDGTSYCYISNSHANQEETQTYFEYKYGDFSIEDGATVTKGQKIGITSDKGSTGTQQIQINLTTDTNGTVYTGNATNGVWNNKYEIDDSINQSTYLGWANEVGENESNIAYNYLIFSGPLKITTTGVEGEWQLVQDWNKGIEGYYTKGGRTYAVYKQGKGPWADLCDWGCSVTCMAIVISGYNSSITPSDTRVLGRNYPNVSTSRMAADFARWGVQAHSTSTASKEKQKVIDWLNAGKILVANVNGTYMPGKSTGNGHFIVLLDYRSSDDSFFVGDPAHSEHVSQWSPLSITWPSITGHHDWVCYIDGGTS